MPSTLILNDTPYEKVDPISEDGIDVTEIPYVKPYNDQNIDWTKKNYSSDGWASISLKSTKRESRFPNNTSFHIDYSNQYDDGDETGNEGQVTIGIISGPSDTEVDYTVTYNNIPGYNQGHSYLIEDSGTITSYYTFPHFLKHKDSGEKSVYDPDNVIRTIYEKFNTFVRLVNAEIGDLDSSHVELFVKNYLRPFFIENFLMETEAYMNNYH